MIRSPRPWVAAAWALCLGAATASADGGAFSGAAPRERAPAVSPALAQNATQVDVPRHRTAGWILVASGVALDVASFVLAEKADDSYQSYQDGTDPIAIDQEYENAVLYDRLASATLIAGQVAIGTGLYLVVLKKPKSPKSVGAASRADESRLAVGYRALGPGPHGVVLTLRF